MGGRRGEMLAAALAAFGELRTQAEMSLDLQSSPVRFLALSVTASSL